ncbi:hypothetical protein D9M71_629830 [compost metagenome]
MLGTALGYRIREGRDGAVGVAQGHTLDLDIGQGTVELQTKVDAAAFLAVGHFTPKRGEAGEFGDDTRTQGLFDQRIGPPGIHAGQPPLRGFADFPGARQLALGVVGAAEPHLPAFTHAVEHGAGVRAVDGQLLAAGQFDIRQKALVAAQQAALFEWGRELHQPCQLRRPRAMRRTASSRRGRLWV